MASLKVVQYVSVLVLAAFASSVLAAEEGHPHIRAALRELREAKTELKEAAHDFGGHRADAVTAVDNAITQLKACLENAGSGTATGSVKAATNEATATAEEAGAKHPHIHAALKELRETRKELKEAAHDYGGHREDAVKAVDAAIEQLELAKKSAIKK